MSDHYTSHQAQRVALAVHFSAAARTPLTAPLAVAFARANAARAAAIRERAAALLTSLRTAAKQASLALEDARCAALVRYAQCDAPASRSATIATARARLEAGRTWAVGAAASRTALMHAELKKTLDRVTAAAAEVAHGTGR